MLKESVERFLQIHDHHHSTLGTSQYYLGAGAAVFIALILSAYAVPNNPFNLVLSAASSSFTQVSCVHIVLSKRRQLQEHVADLSQAVCYVIPGLSRILLPRINALTLLGCSGAFFSLLTCHLIESYAWADGAAAIALAFITFSTLYPLAQHTGAILLQTVPAHIQNQIDRCVSEASRIDGILELRNAHFWQVDFTSIAGTVDVRVRRDASEQIVLAVVTEKLSSVVHILNVQVCASWTLSAYNLFITGSQRCHCFMGVELFDSGRRRELRATISADGVTSLASSSTFDGVTASSSAALLYERRVDCIPSSLIGAEAATTGSSLSTRT